MTISGDKLVVAAIMLTIVVSCVWLVVPAYNSSKTVLQVNGVHGAFVILLPIALAVLPFLYRRATAPSGVALLLFSLLTAIGLWYLPSSILLLLASRSATSQA
jgi:hypothetical protein